MNNKLLAIASDHAGFERKEHIKEYLIELGYSVDDLGTDSLDQTDYPDYGHALAGSVASGKYALGISFCGSGNGINMTANKHQSIRSALCWNEEISALARKHNDANICAMPARFISNEEAEKIVKIFLNTKFDGGRHEGRIKKIPCQ